MFRTIFHRVSNDRKDVFEKSDFTTKTGSSATSLLAGAFAFVLIGVCATPGPCQAATPNQATATKPSAWETLAEIVVDDASLNQGSEEILKAVVGKLSQNPNFAQLEIAYPGLITAFSDALKPIMDAETRRIAPLYRKDLAQLYTSAFTQAEATQIVTAMRSPAMQRFRKAALAARDMRNSTNEVLDEKEISAQSLRSDLYRAGIKAALKIDPADRKAIMNFYATPAGMKMHRLNDKKLAIDQKWANNVSPQAEALIAQRIPEALAEHIAKTDPDVAAEVRASYSKSAI